MHICLAEYAGDIQIFQDSGTKIATEGKQNLKSLEMKQFLFPRPSLILSLPSPKT